MDGVLVVTIVLLLMFLALWLVNWSMSIIGVTVLCLVIGFVSPLLAFGDVHPFAPLWLRLTLIGLILLTYALYGLYRRCVWMNNCYAVSCIRVGKTYRWQGKLKPTCAPSAILLLALFGN